MKVEIDLPTFSVPLPVFSIDWHRNLHCAECGPTFPAVLVVEPRWCAAMEQMVFPVFHVSGTILPMAVLYRMHDDVRAYPDLFGSDAQERIDQAIALLESPREKTDAA